MGRTQRSTRNGQHRQSWQQRHTIREADRLMEQQDDLRTAIRAQFRAI